MTDGQRFSKNGPAAGEVHSKKRRVAAVDFNRKNPGAGRGHRFKKEAGVGRTELNGIPKKGVVLHNPGFKNREKEENGEQPGG